jgi:hypothetical protein
MRMRSVVALAVLSVALSGCASYSRLVTYETSTPYKLEDLTTDAGSFKVRRHPTEQTLYIQPMGKVAMKGVLNADALLDSAAASNRIRPAVMGAAVAYAEGMGCKVTDLAQITGFAWEATYECPR